MKLSRRHLLAGAAAATIPAAARATPEALVARTPMAAPDWALLQRRLLQANAEACEAFYAKYVDRRDWLRVF